MLFAAGSARGQVHLFEDDFDAETPGTALTSLTMWNVVAGSVDVRGDDGMGNPNPLGRAAGDLYLDLTGDADEDATLEAIFPGAPAGDLTLSLDLTGGLTDDNTVVVTVTHSLDGVLVAENILVSAADPVTTFDFPFTVTSPGGDLTLSLENVDGGLDTEQGAFVEGVHMTHDGIDLALTKTVDDTMPAVGTDVTYTLTLSNAPEATQTATGVTVLDDLVGNPDLTFVSAVVSAGAYDTGTGVWTLSSLAPGDTVMLWVTVTVPATPGFVTNEAEVTAADQFDADSTPGDGAGDDWASVTIDVKDTADLAIEKSVDFLSPYAGDVLAFTVVVTNHGPVDADGIRVEDTLDDRLAFIHDSFTATDGTPGFDDLARLVSWDGVSLPAGETDTLRFQAYVSSPVAGPLDNTVAITTWTMPPADPDLANNTSTVTLDVKEAIPFPENVLVQAVDFYTFTPPMMVDPDLTYRLAGTFNFGMYRGIPEFILERRWREANDGLPEPLIVTDIHVLDDGTILISTWGYEGVYRSTDGGRTWTGLVFPVQGDPDDDFSIVYALDEGQDGTLYASADRGRVFRSFDGGLTWQFAGELPGSSADTPWSLVTPPSPDSVDVLYAGTFGRSVYRSPDKGASWAKFDTTGLGDRHIFDLEYRPTFPNLLFAATAVGVYFYDFDLHDGWHSLNDGLVGDTGVGPVEVRSLAFSPGADTLYAATWGFGVFRFDLDGGTMWEEIALRGAQVGALAVNPHSGEVLAGTNGGGAVLLSPGTATAVERLDGETPTAYALEQNYPNPFNPVTTVRFALPEATPARLAVYDLLGRRVAVLVDATLAAGMHEVRFDAANLPSGLYLYRLDTPGATLTRSMVLMK